MALTPAEFHTNAMAAADSDGRLPLPDMAGWAIFPFERDDLRVAVLTAPAAEPGRRGVDPAECDACARRDDTIWHDEHWRVERVPGAGVPLLLMVLSRDHLDLADLSDDRAAALGTLIVHVVRAVEALPHVGRAHVTRWGDGGAHLHVWIWARPAEQPQMRGSCLPLWESVLPEYPAEIAEADASAVATALAASYGGGATRQ